MSLNVIVVDDSTVMRRMVIRCLQMSGLPLGDVHQAANGQEALGVLEENWIDVGLVDINMPVMNGLELLKSIRGTPHLADLKVVVVSTESSEERINELKGMGADFVHKPFSPDSIRKAVARITGASDDQRV